MWEKHCRWGQGGECPAIIFRKRAKVPRVFSIPSAVTANGHVEVTVARRAIDLSLGQ